MSNEDFLKTLIPVFESLLAPEKDYLAFLILSIFLLIASILAIIGTIHWYKHDTFIGITTTIFAVFFVAVTVLSFVGSYKLKQTYDIVYEDYLNRLETYAVEEKKYYQEQAQLLKQREQYTIYLDGVEVDYDSVLFCQYDCKIIDEDKTIYLTHK